MCTDVFMSTLYTCLHLTQVCGHGTRILHMCGCVQHPNVYMYRHVR